jgi:hypothetical protein
MFMRLLSRGICAFPGTVTWSWAIPARSAF